MAATHAKVETPPTIDHDTKEQTGVGGDDLVIYHPPSDLPRIVRYSVDDNPFVVDWAPPQS